MKFTLRLPDNEAAIIEKYCQLTNRTKTDVLREFVRSLGGKVWLIESCEPYTVEEDSELEELLEGVSTDDELVEFVHLSSPATYEDLTEGHW